MRILFSLILFLFLQLSAIPLMLFPVHAIVGPLDVPNNKYGIHIIQATPDESSPAASLVNSSGGDWGYITVIIEDRDRKIDKWQEFFNDLRRRHLIPLVRIATHPEGPANAGWKRPTLGEENEWADFLNNLNWPTKNRYVIIFNEPNHGTEWGNSVDAKSYSETLDRFITALKSKNRDFFVLNAGLDASAPQKLPNYMDQASFMREMDEEIPGIFDKLDGWVSHSYPNPAFSGSPEAFGRGTVRGWLWELQVLRQLGVSKNLPVFITETGWKHAEGINYDDSLLSADAVAENFKTAFETAWNSPTVVAVTPFLLSYQEPLFDHFSFKKFASNDYYPFFQTIQDLPKIKGQPVQETKAQLIKGEVYSSIVAGQVYNISLAFKNIGQSIWGDQVKLVSLEGGQNLGIENVDLPKNQQVEPEQEYTFRISVKAPQSGTYKVALNLFTGLKPFDSPPVEFTTEVKSPVILRIMSSLGWKKDFSGNYLLNTKGATGETVQLITLDKNGMSNDLEARYLLPDYSFEFSLERPFYKPTTIHKSVSAGINILDFGILQPDIISALFHPKELWKLLPFSN